MLIVSYTAGEHLGRMLAAAADANVPDDAVIRAVVEGRGVDLGIDIARPGDKTFYHEGKLVLVVDRQTSESIADMHLDVEVTGEESQLILTDQLEE